MTTHAIPTINVNLKQCTCNEESGRLKRLGDTHVFDCPAAPLLLPCPIPRSVTFQVVLGECTCGNIIASGVWTQDAHADTCPARPVKVSCSVSGKTWEESEVFEVDPSRGPDGYRVQFREEEALATCRARWALMKALVLGERTHHHPGTVEGLCNDVACQRDAVYAALADMARAEEAARVAQRTVDFLLPGAPLSPSHWSATLPSVVRLEAFVEHLIEQVGVL